jgi:hypothetical protein
MNLVLAALIILACAAVAVGALLLVRRWAPDGGYFNDSDRAAGVFGVLATGFAVLLGFIVFLAFASYDKSRSGSETEALVMLQQVETAQFFPEDVRAELRGELNCYGRYVAEQEWPAMEKGEGDEALNPWGLALFETMTSVEPTNAAEETAYAKWFDQTSEREQARQDRLHGAEGIIPSPLWLVLFATAGLIFAYMLFFADSGERAVVQALQIGSVVAIMVATLLVIRLLNEPFHSGTGALKPVAMERALRILETELAGIGQEAELPCSEDGTAV